MVMDRHRLPTPPYTRLPISDPHRIRLFPGNPQAEMINPEETSYEAVDVDVNGNVVNTAREEDKEDEVVVGTVVENRETAGLGTVVAA